ncbi:hypothetical protein EI555_009332, partial [Monodon monoceros]
YYVGRICELSIPSAVCRMVVGLLEILFRFSSVSDVSFQKPGTIKDNCLLFQGGELYFNVLQVVYYGWELLKFIMSKTFLRPKASSTKITNWVDSSFDDFSETTSTSTITATSLGVNNSSLRRKKVPSTVESSKFPARKRGNLSSSKQIYGLENSKEYLSENEPWVDKYKPETQGGSILLITGPPGCGKTTTIKILSKEHGIQVQEWINPVLPQFQKDDFKEIFNPESSFHVFPYQSQIAVFKEFLLRATKYNKLQMLGDDLRTDKKIILVEDLPNQFYRDSHTLHEVLRKYVQIGRCPLIFIISDSLSGGNNQRLLFPKEIQEECAISNISFNPVAPTIMMKFLNRIVTKEANKDGGKIVVPDKTSLELLCQGCSGDIRSAINSLQFSSSTGKNNLWPRKKRMSSLKSDAVLSKSKGRQKPDRIFENQEVQAIGGKDVSLFLFRALGKILYCKRASVTELGSPRLPSHLSEYERDTLLVQPENYIDFFTEVDDLVRASEFLSFADILSGDWNTRSLLREYSTSIATRGVIHSNKARGFAHCQGGGSSFRPLHKPQWFLINKKDIGRLPLKRHFGRLKMEALTDREHGMTDLDSGDEAQLSGRQPAEEALGERTQTAEPETWSLPLSQDSGSELPASQPQPFAAQRDMEEEDIIIEDYESDET